VWCDSQRVGDSCDFGSALLSSPSLLSVRSGAAVSLAGMFNGGAGKKGGKSPRNPIAVCASIINCREKGSQLIPNKHPRKEPDGQGLSQSKESKAVYLVDAKLVGNLLVVAPCQHYCPTLFRSRRRKICCSRNFKTRVIDFAFDLGFRVRNINIQ